MCIDFLVITLFLKYPPPGLPDTSVHVCSTSCTVQRENSPIILLKGHLILFPCVVSRCALLPHAASGPGRVQPQRPLGSQEEAEGDEEARGEETEEGGEVAEGGTGEERGCVQGDGGQGEDAGGGGPAACDGCPPRRQNREN